MSNRAGVTFVLCAIAGVAVLGVVASRSSWLAAGVAVCLFVTPILLVSAVARLGVVVVGALLVFQSAAALPKYFYLGLAIVCVGASLVELIRNPDQVSRIFRPMLLGSGLVVILVLMSFFNSYSLGTPVSNWFRDMLPYLLLAVLPIVGLDASRHLSSRRVSAILTVLSVILAFGFAADWLHRRGASEGLGRIILATATIPLLGFCLALVRSGLGPRRGLNLLGACLIPAFLLVSGTRTFLVALGVALLAVVGSRRKARLPLGRALFVVVLTMSCSALLFVVIARNLITNSTFIDDRFTAASLALNGRVSSDASFIERADSYRQAKGWWLQHPWIGGGPGHIYPTGGFSLDTPWVIPAKFGIIGTLVLFGFLASVAVSVRRSRQAWRPIHSAGRAWALVLLAILPFGPWFEDKGTALALALLVSACAATAREDLVVPRDQAEDGAAARRASGPRGVAHASAHAGPRVGGTLSGRKQAAGLSTAASGRQRASSPRRGVPLRRDH